MTKRIMLILALLLAIPAISHAQVFNCGIGTPNAWTVYTTPGPCSVSVDGFNEGGNWLYRPNSGVITGGAVNLVPIGAGHAGFSLVPQFGGRGGTTPTVNTQAFVEKMQFTWNGNNITMVWQNNGAMALNSATRTSGGSFTGTGTCNLTFNHSSNALATVSISGGTPNNTLSITYWGGSGDGTLPTQAIPGTCTGGATATTFTVTSVSQCPAGVFCTQFNGGAGSEAGCIQSADGPLNVPSNSLCLDIDGYDPMTESGSYSYTTIQLYQPFQVSYLPNTTGTDYIPMYPINKLSTSPVCLNNPCGTAGAGNSDVFELDTTYDHGPGTMKVDLWDVTAGGTCSPPTSGTCFEHIFQGVWLPEIVGNTIAYPTITAGASGGAQAPTVTENINSLSYTVNTPSSPSYTFTTYNANSTYNIGTTSIATPIYSLAPGSYTGAQSLSMSGVTTANGYICQEVVPAGTTVTFYPQTDNNGGCQPSDSTASSGSGLYTGTLSLGVGSWDVYAMSSANNTAFNCPNGCISPSGLGPPSTIVKATYTISSGSAATSPSCTPSSGSSTSPITVTCTNSNSGTTIMCYTENGTTPVTNGAGTGCSTGTSLSGSSNTITISSTVATLNVVAGTSTLADSTVSAYGAYTITSAAATPTFSPVAGTYSSAQSVTISSTSSGAIICYSATTTPATNGTTGCTTGTLYTGPVSVPSSETLHAVAGGTGFSDSSPGTAAYVITTGVTGQPMTANTSLTGSASVSGP